MNHKAGFVNIVGKPNVGKSTLMNALVGMELSITTPKEQTTRHRIRGIVNKENFQIVFSDTPGIIKPAYLLQKKMMQFVETAFIDADIIMYLIDVNEDFKDEEIINKLNSTARPLFLVINKIDLSNQERVKELIKIAQKKLKPKETIPISAKEKFNIDSILSLILDYLPESPPYFPKEEVTDFSERFFVSEIIREKIFFQFKKEIPYSVEVVIESFKSDIDKEGNPITKIRALIIVERESQKGILIGHKGNALKKTGISSRIDIEKFLETKVYLELFVKVKEDWRNDENILRKFGYGL